jgi:hypothetical protein
MKILLFTSQIQQACKLRGHETEAQNYFGFWLDFFFFNILYYYVFSSITFRMLSQKPHTPPISLLTHSHFFGPGIPLYWGI